MSNKTTIKSLLAEASASPSNEIIAAALEQERVEENERKVREVRANLRHVNRAIMVQVHTLRALRERAKRQKNLVLALDAARKEFMKTADFEQFRKAEKQAGR